MSEVHILLIRRCDAPLCLFLSLKFAPKLMFGCIDQIVVRKPYCSQLSACVNQLDDSIICLCRNQL